MKKGLIVLEILKSILIIASLSYFYVNISSGKIILIPFIACGVYLLLKNVFLLFGNFKYNEIFNKIFTISFMSFWFGYLIYLWYVSITNKQYELLFFSIPFLIIGIYSIKTNFFDRR